MADEMQQVVGPRTQAVAQLGEGGVAAIVDPREAAAGQRRESPADRRQLAFEFERAGVRRAGRGDQHAERRHERSGGGGRRRQGPRHRRPRIEGEGTAAVVQLLERQRGQLGRFLSRKTRRSSRRRSSAKARLVVSSRPSRPPKACEELPAEAPPGFSPAADGGGRWVTLRSPRQWAAAFGGRNPKGKESLPWPAGEKAARRRSPLSSCTTSSKISGALLIAARLRPAGAAPDRLARSARAARKASSAAACRPAPVRSGPVRNRRAPAAAGPARGRAGRSPAGSVRRRRSIWRSRAFDRLPAERLGLVHQLAAALAAGEAFGPPGRARGRRGRRAFRGRVENDLAAIPAVESRPRALQPAAGPAQAHPALGGVEWIAPGELQLVLAPTGPRADWLPERIGSGPGRSW